MAVDIAVWLIVHFNEFDRPVNSGVPEDMHHYGLVGPDHWEKCCLWREAARSPESKLPSHQGHVEDRTDYYCVL